MIARRSPLTAVEAEQAVLGGILIRPSALARVRPMLSAPDCFGEAVHQAIYRAVLALADNGTPIDSVTLQGQLGQSDEVQVLAADLVDVACTPENIEHHARMVLDGYRRRAAVEAAEELTRLSSDPAIGIGQALALVSARLVPIASADPLVQRKSLRASLWEAMRRTEERVKAGGALLGASTGFDQLDEYTDGLTDGELWVLAARPSQGKTAMALQIARHVATHHGPAFMASLEMGDDELVERLLSSESGANLRWARKYPEYFDRNCIAIAKAAGILATLPLVLDTHTRTVGMIRMRVQNEILEGRKPAVVLVDYLGLLQSDRPAENRNVELGGMAADLKRMARDFELPVVALAQLNRSSVREDREPQLHDLRDSGEIEQHADVVPMIHWPDGKSEERGRPTNVDLYVRKERNGETGKIAMLFETWTQRFREAEKPGRCEIEVVPLASHRTHPGGGA
jgi:replicative DNA helicase